MSELDPEIPPVGEEIHLPGPSLLPLLTAVGVTLALVGVTTFIELTVIGVILTVVCVVRWIGDTRREIDELPARPPLIPVAVRWSAARGPSHHARPQRRRRYPFPGG